MLAGRIDAVKNASNYDNNSDQNQRVMRPQRGPEQIVTFTCSCVSIEKKPKIGLIKKSSSVGFASIRRAVQIANR